MFIQVIQGRTHVPEQLKEAVDRWYRDLSPGAHGWLGTLAGVTDRGTVIALACFESQQAARRNSERYEQWLWWVETAKLFEGEVVIHDCTDVESFIRGWQNEARCVKIVRSRIRDREALRGFWSPEEQRLIAELRPDILGAVLAVHPDGGCTTVVFFGSVAEAENSDYHPMPEPIKARWQEELQYYECEPVFYRLDDPWLYAP